MWDFEKTMSMIELDLEGYEIDPDDQDCITECFPIKEGN